MNIRRISHLPLVSAIACVLAIAAVPALAGNTVTGSHAVVAGGDLNTASGDYSAVGGGDENIASGLLSTIGGGEHNGAENLQATVGGGEDNAAINVRATVSGGEDNYANGYASTIPGGMLNFAGGDFSFAAGYNAHARMASEVGGSNTTGDQGTFIWADTTGSMPYYLGATQYTSTGPNQFLVRANGGFALNGTPVNANVAMTIQAPASNPGYASIFLQQSNSDNGILVSSGDASTGMTSTANNAAFYVDQYNGSGHTRRLSIDGVGNLAVTAQAYKPGGGAWAASSDARLKMNVQSLDHALDRLLALRGVTFEYSHPDSGMHPAGTFTGFIAQEVETTFPNWIGHDDKGYMTVGPQGFEALTVEALRTLVTEHATSKREDNVRMTKLEADNAALREQLAQQLKSQEMAVTELRRQVAALSASMNVQAIASAPSGK